MESKTACQRNSHGLARKACYACSDLTNARRQLARCDVASVAGGRLSAYMRRANPFRKGQPCTTPQATT